MIKIGRLYINVFVFPLIVAAAITGSLSQLAISYTVVTLHEIAHLIYALKYKVKVASFIIMPFGVCIKLKDGYIENPKTECAICMAGPIANLILMTAGIFIRKSFPTYTELIDYFICSNGAIFLINSIPIIPLDGGRVIRAALVLRYGFIKATKIVTIVSQINIFFVGLLGIYILYITHFNVSVMLLCTFLIFNMSTERKNNEIMLMRQLVYSKRKLAEQKIMPVCQLAADGRVFVRQLLKSFSYDKYYIVSVMDKDMRIRASLTETQIIDALGKNDKQLMLNNLV